MLMAHCWRYEFAESRETSAILHFCNCKIEKVKGGGGYAYVHCTYIRNNNRNSSTSGCLSAFNFFFFLGGVKAISSPFSYQVKNSEIRNSK